MGDGQAYNIKVTAFDTIYQKRADTLNSVGPGFVHSFTGGRVVLYLLLGELVEGDLGFVVFNHPIAVYLTNSPPGDDRVGLTGQLR